MCPVFANKSDRKLNKHQVQKFIVLKVKNKKQKLWLKELKISLKIKGLKLNKETNWSDKLGLRICLSAYYCLFNCQVA